MKFKKFLSYLLLVFFTLTNYNGIINAAEFTQTSDPQYSTNVNEGDVVEANKWNAVVYDISNIIADIASLKQYADDSIKNYFNDDGTNLSYSDKNVSFAKNLEIGGKIETDKLDINAGALPNNVIITDDIKNGSLKQEDLDPNIDYGQDVVFKENGSTIYYDQGNIGIGDNNPDEKVVIKNGSLKIKGTGNGIIFGDGSKLTTLPVLSNDNVLTESDQTINGNKQFADGIKLNRYYTGNIFKFQTNPTYTDNKYTSGHHMGYNTDDSYFYVGTTGGYAEFDGDVKRTGKSTLHGHIEQGAYIEIKHGTHGYHGNKDEPLKLIPGMTYKTGVWVKTQFTGSSNHGALLRILTHDADGNAKGEYDLMPWIKTTTDWTFYQATFTAPANAVQGHVEFRIYGHTGDKTLKGDAWRDVNGFYIIPVLNADSRLIKYISKDLTGDITDVTKASQTVVTEKAIQDYINTKETKQKGECSYASKEYYYYLSKPIYLCDIGEGSDLQKDDSNKRYTWKCIGPDGGETVSCASQTCVPHNVTETIHTIEKVPVNVTKKIYVTWCDTCNNLRGYGNSWANNNSVLDLIKEWKSCKSVTYSKKINTCDNNYGGEAVRNITHTYNNNITHQGSNGWNVNYANSLNCSNSSRDQVREYNCVTTQTELEEKNVTKTITYDENYCETDGINFDKIGNTTDDSKDLKDNGGVYTYNDGSVAKSCLEYKNNATSDTPSGTYKIKPGSTEINVYCDMVTDGGGWTRFIKYKESDGGKRPGKTISSNSYKLAISLNSNPTVMLNGCNENRTTLILKPHNNLKKWIETPENRPLTDIINANQLYTLQDINGNTIRYGHNNGSSNGTTEFETLTFSTHHHTIYHHIRKYAKWGVIDGGLGNTWSSYNNETSYANGDMNNSNHWVCAYYK